MHEDVEAAEFFPNGLGYEFAAVNGGYVGGNKEVGPSSGCRRSPSRRKDIHPFLSKPLYDSEPDALRASGDQRTAALQFQSVRHESSLLQVGYSPFPSGWQRDQEFAFANRLRGFLSIARLSLLLAAAPVHAITLAARYSCVQHIVYI
jgi:hypothetical protein